MSRVSKSIQLLVAGLLLGNCAYAEKGAYIGGELGTTDQQIHYDPYFLASNPAGDVSKNSTTFGVFAGYQFNSYFGLELGYRDFGKVSSDSGAVSAKAEQTLTSLLVGWPITQDIKVYARLGVSSYHFSATANSAAGGNYDTNQVASVWGLGAQYRLANNVDARIDYTHTDNASFQFFELNQISTKYDTTTLGVRYRF